jgi:hypothetical protein
LQKKKLVLALLLTVPLIGFLAPQILVVFTSHASSPGIVQEAVNGTNSSSYVITFASPVTSGDLIIISEGQFENQSSTTPSPVIISDNQSNSYTPLVYSALNGTQIASGIWYTIANTSGPISINVTDPNCTSCGVDGGVAYELYGYTPSLWVTGNSTNAACCSTSTSFYADSGDIIITGAVDLSSTHAWGAGTGYSLAPSNATNNLEQSEYAVWNGGSTNASLSDPGNSWVETALVLVPSIGGITDTSTVTQTSMSVGTLIVTSNFTSTATSDVTTTFTQSVENSTTMVSTMVSNYTSTLTQTTRENFTTTVTNARTVVTSNTRSQKAPSNSDEYIIVASATAAAAAGGGLFIMKKRRAPSVPEDNFDEEEDFF